MEDVRLGFSIGISGYTGQPDVSYPLLTEKYVAPRLLVGIDR